MLIYLASCSSLYMFLWIFFNSEGQMSWAAFFFLGGLIFYFLSHCIILLILQLDRSGKNWIRKESSSSCPLTILNSLVLFLFPFTFGVHFIPSFWTELFPTIAVLISSIRKLLFTLSPPKRYLTRFEISNWILISIWIVLFLRDLLL